MTSTNVLLLSNIFKNQPPPPPPRLYYFYLFSLALLMSCGSAISSLTLFFTSDSSPLLSTRFLWSLHVSILIKRDIKDCWNRCSYISCSTLTTTTITSHQHSAKKGKTTWKNSHEFAKGFNINKKKFYKRIKKNSDIHHCLGLLSSLC